MKKEASVPIVTSADNRLKKRINAHRKAERRHHVHHSRRTKACTAVKYNEKQRAIVERERRKIVSRSERREGIANVAVYAMAIVA